MICFYSQLVVLIFLLPSLHCVIHTSSVQIEPRLNCPQLHLVIQRPLRVLCYTAGRDAIDCTDIHAGTDAA